MKLLREHGLIGEEGASDESVFYVRCYFVSNKCSTFVLDYVFRTKNRSVGVHELKDIAVSITRADIIFQKVVSAEQKRKAMEEVNA